MVEKNATVTKTTYCPYISGELLFAAFFNFFALDHLTTFIKNEIVKFATFKTYVLEQSITVKKGMKGS